jgi:adenosylmethionine-8-amino-7-oxononanoate aminotransferase
MTSFWHPFADMGAVRSAELVVERGEDVWIWDADGRRYFDATASLWYANVGHGRGEIADAVAAQMRTLEAYSHFGDFTSKPAAELCDRLADLAPMHDPKVFLASGGGDGVDSAFKIARRYWSAVGQAGRTHVISRTASYHGTHGFGTAIAGIPANRAGFGPLLEDNTVVPYDSVDALADTIGRLGPERVAAFFCEPVIGAGGVYPPPDGYLEGVAEVCRESGVLFVCDSVICGFGRLGTWFGIERWGVEPDLIVFAKGVTSGYLPLGGVVVSGEVAEPFWSAPGGPVLRHGVTYAGHASCCAAALANLDILEREHLLERGRELEVPLHRTLEELTCHPLVAAARGGVGAMAALELDAALVAEHPTAPMRLAMAAREHGVLVRPLVSAIALSPPLTATEEHLALVGEALFAGLETLATVAA